MVSLLDFIKVLLIGASFIVEPPAEEYWLQLKLVFFNCVSFFSLLESTTSSASVSLLAIVNSHEYLPIILSFLLESQCKPHPSQY